MPVTVNSISMTLTQEPGKEKPLLLKTKSQIFLTGIFLHRPIFSLLGKQEPSARRVLLNLSTDDPPTHQQPTNRPPTTYPPAHQHIDHRPTNSGTQ